VRRPRDSNIERSLDFITTTVQYQHGLRGLRFCWR
jgi:hypothetical protein